jgi:hypothetical protein
MIVRVIYIASRSRFTGKSSEFIYFGNVSIQLTLVIHLLIVKVNDFGIQNSLFNGSFGVGCF